jgi:(5-formylfuran-3-yl)methyl phosphate synthase
MRLLVSVRAGDEAAAALAGGADIIDAKEPARGSLGPVCPDVLLAIATRVPDTVPLSLALGDFTEPDAVRLAVAGSEVPVRRAPTYVKLGFAGERSEAAVTSLVAAAIDAAAATAARPVVVPVAYADHENANSPAPAEVLSAAMAAGARAFLIDTCLKDGRGLLKWITVERLRRLSADARSAGMLVAIAGSLSPTALDPLVGIADVIGVRGAACRGGREGSVDAALVRRLRDQWQGSRSRLQRLDERLLA